MKKLIPKILLLLIFASSILGGVIVFTSQFLGINMLNNIDLNISQNQTTKLPQNIEVDLSLNQITSEVITAQSEVTVRFLSNKPVKVVNSGTSTIVYEEKFEGSYRYILKISNLGIGESSRQVSFQTEFDNFNYENLSSEQKDSNQSTLTWTIIRENMNLGFGQNAVDRFADSGYVFDGDDLKSAVSKKMSLTSDYVPNDLVDLNIDKLLYTNSSNILLRSEAADALASMLRQLKKDTGKDIVIASGYRSFRNQESTYAGWMRQFGQEEADKISARPGYSEHQLGTSVDFFSQDSGFEFTNKFDQTAAGKWLIENSYKFGFIQTYPEGKESITGYNYESWHYRYVGLSIANEVMKNQITLTELLMM